VKKFYHYRLEGEPGRVALVRNLAPSSKQGRAVSTSDTPLAPTMMSGAWTRWGELPEQRAGTNSSRTAPALFGSCSAWSSLVMRRESPGLELDHDRNPDAGFVFA
jgi:hypothetical protein